MPGTFSLATYTKGKRWLATPACITARAWRTCRDACRDRLYPVAGKTFPTFPAHAPAIFRIWQEAHSAKAPVNEMNAILYYIYMLWISKLTQWPYRTSGPHFLIDMIHTFRTARSNITWWHIEHGNYHNSNVGQTQNLNLDKLYIYTCTYTHVYINISLSWTI